MANMVVDEIAQDDAAFTEGMTPVVSPGSDILPDPAEVKVSAGENDNFEIEIIDDTPEEDRGLVPEQSTISEDISDEELQTYGSKVRTRISKQTTQIHAERRRADKAERELSEAIRHIGAIRGQNESMVGLVQESHKTLNEEVFRRAQAILNGAQQTLADAHTEGDPENISRATLALTEAQSALQKAPEVSSNLIDAWQRNTAQRARAIEIENAAAQSQAALSIQEPTESARAWYERNPWLGRPGNEEMTSFVYGFHEKIIKEGNIAPDSPEYWEAVDTRMREMFPNNFYDGSSAQQQDNNAGTPVASSPTRRRTPPVPPSARSNGAMPRKLTLTSTQVALARKIGVPLKVYAQELHKLGEI
jgi:flagellar hook-basal body complex protein FliE